MSNVATTRTTSRRRRQVGHSGPTDKEREYLEVIYYLSEQGERVIAARLARWMGVQPPTVTHVVQQLEQKGFIARDGQGLISLTSTGHALARQVVRRHSLLERFLQDVMHIAWHLLHAEAVRLEHVLSPTLEARIEEMIGDATTCPHGNPIPARMPQDDPPAQTHLVALQTVQAGQLFTVRRVVEEAEENIDLLHYLHTTGLTPGEQLFVVDVSPVYGMTLRRCMHNVTISPELVAVLWGETETVV